MKYIKKFDKEADIMMEVQPNVVLAADTGKVSYNVPITYPKGVFVQHIDGTLYSEENWTSGGFSNDEANGVAVITEKASFVIAKTDLGLIDWSSKPNTLVDGILTTTDKATALTDFAGYNNTQLMLATDTSGAGYACANYTFPNGDKGYLPALGELEEAYANKSKIDSLMTKIGGSEITLWSWSSTQKDAKSSWSRALHFDSIAYYAKDRDFCVRAFTSL